MALSQVVGTTQDTLVELNETFTVSASDGSGIFITPGAITVTIIDDDGKTLL